MRSAQSPRVSQAAKKNLEVKQRLHCGKALREKAKSSKANCSKAKSKKQDCKKHFCISRRGRGAPLKSDYNPKDNY